MSGIRLIRLSHERADEEKKARGRSESQLVALILEGIVRSVQTTGTFFEGPRKFTIQRARGTYPSSILSSTRVTTRARINFSS
jgi:hypothetical protein